MFRPSILLKLMAVAAWLTPNIASATANGDTREQHSMKIHMVVVADNNFQSKYEALFERMESFANRHEYLWHIIGSSEGDSCHQKFKEFFFRKHCMVADWAGRKTNPGDKIFVFDADVVPFRPQTPLDYWLEMSEDLIFYDRTWNNEIMAGNYMIRNVPRALAFLNEWAQYEYKRPPGFSSADNGAIHLHLAETLFRNSESDTTKTDLDICSLKYQNLTESVENLDPYFSYVGCTREIVPAGSYSIDDLSIRIAKKNTAWVMDGVYDSFDGHQVESEASLPLPIFHHGVKINNFEEDSWKYVKYNLTIPVSKDEKTKEDEDEDNIRAEETIEADEDMHLELDEETIRAHQMLHQKRHEEAIEANQMLHQKKMKEEEGTDLKLDEETTQAHRIVDQTRHEEQFEANQMLHQNRQEGTESILFRRLSFAARVLKKRKKKSTKKFRKKSSSPSDALKKSSKKSSKKFSKKSKPSGSPSESPSESPSKPPSESPSGGPNSLPSSSPSKSPSESPSGAPSQSPSRAPSSMPSLSPSGKPSGSPSESPSESPSGGPSSLPSSLPSKSPSKSPSGAPSQSPSRAPSSMPSLSPSGKPSGSPSESPSESPSGGPSSLFSSLPSESASESPSGAPSQSPSRAPSSMPSVATMAPTTTPTATTTTTTTTTPTTTTTTTSTTTTTPTTTTTTTSTTTTTTTTTTTSTTTTTTTTTTTSTTTTTTTPARLRRLDSSLHTTADLFKKLLEEVKSSVVTPIFQITRKLVPQIWSLPHTVGSDFVTADGSSSTDSAIDTAVEIFTETSSDKEERSSGLELSNEDLVKHLAEHRRLHQEALMQHQLRSPLKKRSGPRPVSCGAHKANSCDECPQGHGRDWCNGDCKWILEENTCIQGPRYIPDEYEDLIDLDLYPFQPVRDENGNLINIMLIRSPLDFMQRLTFDHYKEKIVFLGIMSYETFPLPSPNPFATNNNFDDDMYVGNPWIQGWLNMYRNPRDIFDPNTPIVQISQSDFALPEIEFDQEVNDGKHEKRYDFVYSMSNGGHPFNEECTGWGPEAKNWTFAKEALEVMCGELNLLGVLLVTRDQWDSKPCKIPKSCDGKIVQTPFLDQDEAMSYFRQSRFLFVPQVNDASPRVITQALSLNVPVLMNKNIIGGWKYINNQTGEFFNDLSDFKEAYRRLEANIDLEHYKPREYVVQNYGNRNAGKRFFDFVNENFAGKVQLPEDSEMLIPS